MFRGLLLLVLVSVLTFPPVREVLAQASDDLSELKKEVEALKKGQLQLQRELQEINALLRRRQPSATDVQNVVLPIDGFPSKGSQSARLILIEFTDYQCPFCSRHVQQTLPQIERDYVNTGQVRYVVRDFPLESIHKDALKAAEAAHCAGEHLDSDKYAVETRQDLAEAQKMSIRATPSFLWGSPSPTGRV
jgi:protein-disulfide isomerase